MSIRDESSLFGPDVSDAPTEVIEPVNDGIDDLDIWAAQFVNRWVFLAHQRPAAFKELRELIAEAKGHDMAETCRNAGCQEIR